MPDFAPAVAVEARVFGEAHADPIRDHRGPHRFPQVLFAGRPDRTLARRQLAVAVAVSDALPTVVTIELSGSGKVLSELPVSTLELTSTAPADEVTRARAAALRTRQRRAQRDSTSLDADPRVTPQLAVVRRGDEVRTCRALLLLSLMVMRHPKFPVCCE